MKPEFIGEVMLRPTFAPRLGISHVLFDFDGTLSLIRQGWPEVMVPMFTEALPAVPGETEADRGRLAFEDIMRLNGKQTIYQMMQLAARIRERGGEAKEPLWYKHEYLRRLDLRIKDRIDGLRQGTIPADDLLVHGARRLLENLKVRGLPVYLASGTDEIFVKQVVLSIGSAIMGPQVFEKSLSCVNNLRLQDGRPIVAGHSIHVIDLQDGGGWDWSRGEPPKTNPAYYLRFCKSYARMGGEMHYLQCDNAVFLHNLYHQALQA